MSQLLDVKETLDFQAPGDPRDPLDLQDPSAQLVSLALDSLDLLVHREKKAQLVSLV
jgi:hypothetical protein